MQSSTTNTFSYQRILEHRCLTHGAKAVKKTIACQKYPGMQLEVRFNIFYRTLMHIHILGICGTFMGGIAALAREAGHRVTGCDANVYPPMSTQLEAQGIDLIEGFTPDQVGIGA